MSWDACQRECQFYKPLSYSLSYTSRKRFRIRPRSPLASAPTSSVPGVSILRPLKGLDANLYENLESTFTQDYPKFELLLCVDNEHDQALTVVRDLLSKYPHVNARILVGALFASLTFPC